MDEDDLIAGIVYEAVACLDEFGRMRLMANLAEQTFPEHTHAGDLFLIGPANQRVAIIIASGRHADPVMEMNDKYAQADAIDHPETIMTVKDHRRKP